MHTVELLAEAREAARQLGYRIREENMGGIGGGACELDGRKWLFLDLMQSPLEQLEALVATLREDPATLGMLDALSPALVQQLGFTHSHRHAA